MTPYHNHRDDDAARERWERDAGRLVLCAFLFLMPFFLILCVLLWFI